MTLDEAIAHHERAMKESEGDVATRHWQHAMWLKELKTFRMENARLRRECDYYFGQVEENEQRHQIAYDRLARENDELRSALVKALDVQAELCANRDLRWCREECSLYRSETNDCEACDPIDTAYRLGALPKGMLVCIPKDVKLEELGIEMDQ